MLPNRRLRSEEEQKHLHFKPPLGSARVQRPSEGDSHHDSCMETIPFLQSILCGESREKPAFEERRRHRERILATRSHYVQGVTIHLEQMTSTLGTQEAAAGVSSHLKKKKDEFLLRL